MRKAFQFAITMLVCVSALVLTGCKDTAALKAAVEEASKSCPLSLDNLGEATSIAFGDKSIDFNLKPLQALVECDKIDKSLIARYLALELQRKNPELVKLMVDGEFGIKCNLEGDEEPILVEAKDLKKFSSEFLTAGGKVAPILLPLFNQQLSAKFPLEIGEGLSIHKVKVVDGVETFFVNVDESKVKFDTVREKIVNIARKVENAKEIKKELVEEKVKFANVNLSLLLPLLNELNYGAMFRYANKTGSETYMEITAEEIEKYLAPAEEEQKEG